MKLGSKKHLQNPKLHTASSNGASGGSKVRTGIVNPKTFKPTLHKKKKN